MLVLLVLLCLPAEIEVIDAPGFPRERQVAGVSATVRVVNKTQTSEGSGALIGRIGPLAYVLTAAHVVAGAERVDVEMFSAQSHPRPEQVVQGAEVIARAPEADLALVEVPLRDPPPGTIRVCPQRLAPREGALVALSVGCTDGKAPTCRAEKISGKKQVRRPNVTAAVWMWQAEQASVQGRSGGPLVDARGHLIGVASGTGKDRGYYSHLDEIHDFLKRKGLKSLFEEP